jgi:hypothetical protein
LYRPPYVKRLLLDSLRQIGDHGIAHLAARQPVENQAHRAGFVVLAYQHDGPMEKRAVQFPAVQKEVPLPELGWAGHGV